MNKSDIAIIVPIYKIDLNPFEKISLEQLRRTLIDYSIFFVCPNSLIIDGLSEVTGFQIERFDDCYFSGIESYSRFCTSEDLYLRFISFEYILIYQLDAFVFSDNLLCFCEKGYDYYGAPIPDRIWPYLNNKIGSGGLSLRRISSTLDMVRNQDRIMSEYKKEYPEAESNKAFYLEDRFFAYCAQRADIQYSVPGIEEALKFAIEFNVDDIYNGIENHLPFGCHKWYAENFDFWWPLISQYGYKVSEADIKTYTHCGAEHERWIRCEELAIGDKSIRLRSFIRDIIDSDNVRIYGNGDMGKSAIKVLNLIGISIQAVFDGGINPYNREGALTPSEDNLKSDDLPIIICSKDAGKIIENNLLRKISNKTKCFQWIDIEKDIVDTFSDMEE